MAILFSKINNLCICKGISIGKMCGEIGISRGNLSELKMERIKTLSIEALTKIANYFDVPINYLLGQAPFTYWEEVDTNRKELLNEMWLSEELITKILGDGPLENVDTIAFIKFIDSTAKSIDFVNGRFNIVMKPWTEGKDKLLSSDGNDTLSSTKKKAPVIDDEDLKFALFGDTDITDDVLEEVLRFARFVKEQTTKG